MARALEDLTDTKKENNDFVVDDTVYGFETQGLYSIRNVVMVDYEDFYWN